MRGSFDPRTVILVSGSCCQFLLLLLQLFCLLVTLARCTVDQWLPALFPADLYIIESGGGDIILLYYRRFAENRFGSAAVGLLVAPAQCGNGGNYFPPLVAWVKRKHLPFRINVRNCFDHYCARKNSFILTARI